MSYQNILSICVAVKQGQLLVTVLLINALEQRRSAQWEIVCSLPEVVFHDGTVRVGPIHRNNI